MPKEKDIMNTQGIVVVAAGDFAMCMAATGTEDAWCDENNGW